MSEHGEEGEEGRIYGLQEAWETLLPFDVTHVTFSDPVVGEISTMSREDVPEIWRQIFTDLGVRENTVKEQVAANIIWFLIKNGASSRIDFSQHTMRIQGRTYSLRPVATRVGRDIRRFARAHADYARALMRAKPDVARELANRRGLRENADLAFDFADACTGLTMEQRSDIQRLKDVVLSATTPFDSVDTVVAGGVSSTRPSAESIPVRLPPPTPRTHGGY